MTRYCCLLEIMFRALLHCLLTLLVLAALYLNLLQYLWLMQIYADGNLHET